MHNYRKLQVWQRAMDFTARVYVETANFPKEEKFGLTSQLRRACASIPLNIADGSGNSSDKEFRRFLEIAIRSGYETSTAIEIAERLGFWKPALVDILQKELDEIIAMLFGLHKRFTT